MPRYLDTEWQAMLKVLAQRDAPAEMSRPTAGQEGPTVVYRGRLFEVLANGEIIIERPKQAVSDNAFGPGDDIELLLSQQSERLIATCTIRETLIRQINDGVRVTCFRLSPGRRPKREQRRAFFRVNVAAMVLEPVELCDPETEQTDPILGRLTNLSGGGIGVCVRAGRKTLDQIKRTKQFICVTQFNADHIRIKRLANVTYISELGDDGLYLGLRFVFEDPTEARTHEDLMVQLCAKFQRKQLQRRRA